MNTPWGRSNHCEQIAEGLAFHSTASHGGYKLSALLNDRVHSIWRQPSGWYEEDCQALIVVWSFPKFFPRAVSRWSELEASLEHWFPGALELVRGAGGVL